MNEVQAVYRAYTQIELDDQYNNRARVPNNTDIMRDFAEIGEAFVAEHPRHGDLAFGDTPDELVDVYPATNGDPNAPVLMYFHGGFWYSRHKDDFKFIGAGFAPEGVTVVVVNYSLIPSVDMVELIRQCRASVAWTAQNIAGYGGNPQSIYLCGHSAGGHITAMMFATDWSEWGVDPSIIKGGLAISGIYDLEPIRLSFMNETLGFNEQIVDGFSPLKLTRSVEAPIIFSVGGDESDEFLRHCELLIEPWQVEGLSCEQLILPGLNHFTVLDDLTSPSGQQHQKITEMMGIL